MINYFKDLFTKPKYQWTALDEWVVIGLAFAVLIIVGLIWLGIYILLDLRKKYKYKKCAQKKPYYDICWNHNDCLNCGHYKKKSKKVGGESE